MGLPNPAFVPFRPKGLSNPAAAPTGQVPLALTAAVQTLTLPANSSEGGTLRIVVDGGTGLAWCYGVNPLLTINNGEHMLAGSFDTFELEKGWSQISVIGASAAGTIRVHFGEGS